MGWEDVLDQRAKQDPYMRAQSDPNPASTSFVPDGAPLPTRDNANAALTSAATDTPTPPTNPAAVPSKARQNLDAALNRVYDINAIQNKGQLLAAYDQNKDSMAKNIGKSMAFALRGASPVLMDKNVDNRTALGYTIGTAMSGALKGVFNKSADEEVMRDMDRQDAYGELDAAQKAYSVEDALNSKELRDRDTESQIKYRDNMGQAAIGRVENAAEKNSIDKLGKLTGLVKSGVISRDQANGQFADVMSDLVGAPVKIDQYDPNKDSIKGYRILQDADGNRAIQATVYKDGRTEYRDVLDPNTGQPAHIKSDRVKQAEIQGNTQVTTTGMRTASAETIAKMNNDVRMQLGYDALDQKDQKDVDDLVQNSVMMDGGRQVIADIISATPGMEGQSPEDIPQEQWPGLISAAVKLKLAQRKLGRTSVVKRNQ